MKTLAIVGIVLLVGLVLGVFALGIYGLVLGFSAHIFVGIIHLVLTPLSFITGFTMFFFDYDLGMALAQAMNL